MDPVSLQISASADWPIALAGRLEPIEILADWPIAASRLEPIECRVASWGEGSGGGGEGGGAGGRGEGRGEGSGEGGGEGKRQHSRETCYAASGEKLEMRGNR